MDYPAELPAVEASEKLFSSVEFWQFRTRFELTAKTASRNPVIADRPEEETKKPEKAKKSDNN